MSSMTDIVFLLLIFFMVLSTLVQQKEFALKLQLPKGDIQAVTKPQLQVSITKNNAIYVGNTRVTKSTIEQELHKRLSKNRDITIALRADKRALVENLVHIMYIAKKNKYKLVVPTTNK